MVQKEEASTRRELHLVLLNFRLNCNTSTHSDTEYTQPQAHAGFDERMLGVGSALSSPVGCTVEGRAGRLSCLCARFRISTSAAPKNPTPLEPCSRRSDQSICAAAHSCRNLYRRRCAVRCGAVRARCVENSAGIQILGLIWTRALKVLPQMDVRSWPIFLMLVY